MDRCPSWREGLLIAAAAAALSTGCAGSIDDPSAYYAASSSCPSDFDVERDLFAGSCAGLGCHSGEDAAAGLDLASAGVAERLRTHRSGLCEERPLLVPGDRAGSYLLEKLEAEPTCGETMPSGMPELGASERACLEAYLEELTGVPFDGAPVDAGVVADAEVRP
jgi:hypothetical protein